MGLPPNLVLKNTNYFNSNGSYENLYTVGIEQKFPFLKGTTVSFDVGGKCDTKFDENNIKLRELNSMCEARVKLNLTDNINIGARYRNFDRKNQFRITFGASYPLTNRLSIYGDAHATFTQDMKNESTSLNTGAYTGLSYKFKSIDGLSVFAEGQVNRAVVKNFQPTGGYASSFNCGLKYSF